jgi:hypothetical protein
MKRLIVTMLLAAIFHFTGQAQEKFGGTLNLGLGVGGYSGYSSYTGRTLPVLHVNYEIDVARNFTLAPFVSLYTFSKDYYWEGNNHPAGYYTYRETVIPVGVKGSYYFDELFGANDDWDFYAAGSLGFAVVKSHWQDGYFGDRNHYHRGSALFLDVHIGVEYHFNNHLGGFLDISSGISTIGLAIH